MWLDTWGGLEPDTAMSIAAVNQLPGVPGGLVRWGERALQPFLTGEAFGFVRFCLAWQIAEGECPTRR